MNQFMTEEEQLCKRQFPLPLHTQFSTVLIDYHFKLKPMLNHSKTNFILYFLHLRHVKWNFVSLK